MKRQRCIMVVDDDATSRTMLDRILSAAGFVVEAVESAEAALQRLADFEPDAFVLDVEMPGMNGIELCQRLRADARFRFRPILMMTGSDSAQTLRRAFAAGCDDFLEKPPTPLVVTARLGGQLQKYEVFRQLDRVRQNLSRYISPRVRQMIETVVDTGRTPPPRERDVCILFSDIRGFTALSQKIEPGLVFSTISRHLGAQVDAVYRHRGYIDKFGGDGIMAVFDGDDMAWDACQCALEIMDLAERMEPEDGVPPMPIGIGIHMGKVVEGNIGTTEHLDYSVIGNTVNLAARLCGYAHSKDIIVSEAVRAAVNDPALGFVDPREAHIRGLREPILLYRLSRMETAKE
mgnify:CR=1 FL=1